MLFIQSYDMMKNKVIIENVKNPEEKKKKEKANESVTESVSSRSASATSS